MSLYLNIGFSLGKLRLNLKICVHFKFRHNFGISVNFDKNLIQHIKTFQIWFEHSKIAFLPKTPMSTEFTKLPLLKPILDSLQGVFVKFTVNSF